jgi:general secretion pathway protein D
LNHGPDQNRLIRRSWKIAGQSLRLCRAFLKEDPKLQKAIGLITCASVMAVSLYLFSGGDPSRTLSAGTDSKSGDGYSAAARRFLQDARQKAEQGNLAEARRLAKTAATLSSEWSEDEESPEQFLNALAESESSFSDTSEASDEAASAEVDSEESNPFEEAEPVEMATEEPATSGDLLKKKQAQRLVKEARQAIAKGDMAAARSRAVQARQLNAPWGLWDDRPEHVLADLDKKSKTATFVAGRDRSPSEPVVRSKNAEHEYQQATTLLQQARAAMDAGKLEEARQLADEAAAFDVAYGIFEDSPAMIVRDIERLENTDASANSAFAAAGSGNSSEAAEQARQLLREAREAIVHGRLSVAREKAAQASALNVAYTVLDDRPELVLNDIESAMRGQGKAAANRADNIAAAGSATQSDAQRLVTQARGALKSGDTEKAQQLALEAQQQDAAFGLFEDRPETVLEEAQMMAGQKAGINGNTNLAQNGPVDVTTGDKKAGAFAAHEVQPANFDDNDFPVLAPEGESASEAYRRGIAAFRSGNRPAAKAAFTSAWKNAGELSSTERRQLQDFLQDLATSSDVQLASGRKASNADSEDVELSMNPVSETDPLTAAADASDVHYDRLRTEVMNSVFRAEKLKTANPAEALQILDNTLATVEAAPLNKEALETLAGYVRRSQETVRAYQEQQGPNLAQEQKNRNVMEAIKRETESKIRIEQEFAELVDQYNELMKERRYAEAELLAKKARDLNPDLPQATIMLEKAKMQRQIAFNSDVRERKADSFTQQLNDVELASIMPPGGDYSLPNAKSWGELSKRREKFGRVDSRERTESELQIEKSLGQKVSLHFHDVALTEVIRHIATVHGINIAMKTRAIETEGLTASQPVSIDVDGITLSSALNLLLDQAGGLVYSIENETLMITNRLEQETKLELRTYNVADLVIPVGNNNGIPGNATSPTSGGAPRLNSGVTGNGLYQVHDELSIGINRDGRSNSSSNTSAAANGADFSGLIELLTTTIEPGTWDVDGGSGTIGTNENTLSLVIRQTSATHEQVADLLKQLRKLQDLQVTVEVRFISVSDNFFERIGVDFDFNVQDSLGDPVGVPAFGSRQLTFPGGTAAGGGGGGQQGQAGDLRGGQQQGGGQQGGQQGQQGQQGQGGGGSLFDRVSRVNSPRDDFRRTTVGMSAPGQFTEDYDIQFRQGSFEIGVPDFGGFQPNAGIQVGMAILSDIEAFFFIQAAQGDSRSNIMTAPKVTMYNGQFATVADNISRSYVQGQIPVVGQGGVGFQPLIGQINDGVTMTVNGVVSADRRYVRLSIIPVFQQLIDLQTFTSVGGGNAAGFGGGGGGFGGGGGGGGFGGGGGGGGGQFGFGGIGGGFGGGGGGGGFGGGQQGGGQQGQQGQQGGGGSTGTIQLPVYSNLTVTTVVSVPDGGTVLLGGIKRLREGRNMAGVPILNKIPYISRLFKNSGVGRETESIMLMVTPRIIIQEEEEELIIGTATE